MSGKRHELESAGSKAVDFNPKIAWTCHMDDRLVLYSNQVMENQSLYCTLSST
jgi:hypothetical protein